MEDLQELLNTKSKEELIQEARSFNKESVD